MDTSHLHPFVIWSDKTKRGHYVLRVVDRGPVRAGKEETGETQFILEHSAGHNGMYVKRWLPINREILWTVMPEIVAVLGQTLGARPELLEAGHLIGCEINLARIEGRETRGCDCLGAPGRYGRPDPQEPEAK